MPLESSCSWIEIATVAINCLLLAVTTGGMIGAWITYLKQKKDQLRADYTKRYQDIIRDFPEDVNEPDFSLTKGSGTERGDARFEKTMRAMRMYFDLCFEEWSLHNGREIDDTLWEVWEGGMATAFEKPAFRQAWARITRPHDTKYGDRFNQFVESHMQ